MEKGFKGQAYLDTALANTVYSMFFHRLTIINSFSLQWEIYDSYVKELQKQEKNKEKQKAALSKKDNDKSKRKTMLMETQVT